MIASRQTAALSLLPDEIAAVLFFDSAPSDQDLRSKYETETTIHNMKSEIDGPKIDGPKIDDWKIDDWKIDDWKIDD
jgi:hypothetical protein